MLKFCMREGLASVDNVGPCYSTLQTCLCYSLSSYVVLHLRSLYVHVRPFMFISSVLAVGGTDDSIQILQRKQAPPTRPGPPTRHTQPSLLSYCEYIQSYTCIRTYVQYTLTQSTDIVFIVMQSGDWLIMVCCYLTPAVKPVDSDKFIHTHWLRGD